MRVTVSILCYNYGRFLSAAIESALTQAPCPGVELEVLVIDDGSTDETPQICAGYGTRIRASRTENRGFGASLARAVTEAQGDYVFLLDADDYFAPTKVAALLPLFDRQIGMVWDRQVAVDEAGRPINDRDVHGGNTSTIAVRRAWALELLPLDNEMSFHVIAEAGHARPLNAAHTYYRLHGSSMTNRRQPGAQYTYLSRVSGNLAARLDEFAGLARTSEWLSKDMAAAIARDYRSQSHFEAMEAALQRGEVSRARGEAWKMIVAARGGRKALRWFHARQLVRALLGRPNFRYQGAAH